MRERNGKEEQRKRQGGREAGKGRAIAGCKGEEKISRGKKG